jgi:hypothetical protein
MARNVHQENTGEKTEPTWNGTTDQCVHLGSTKRRQWSPERAHNSCTGVFRGDNTGGKIKPTLNATTGVFIEITGGKIEPARTTGQSVHQGNMGRRKWSPLFTHNSSNDVFIGIHRRKQPINTL